MREQWKCRSHSNAFTAADVKNWSQSLYSARRVCIIAEYTFLPYILLRDGYLYLCENIQSHRALAESIQLSVRRESRAEKKPKSEKKKKKKNLRKEMRTDEQQ